MASRKKISTGYTGNTDALPESKRFGGSPESDAQFDARDVMNCHVGGVPVREMPILTQRMIHYDQTDEGFAARQEGRTGVLEGMTDSVDKELTHRRDDLREGVDPRFAHSPIKFMDRYKKPGMKLKLLSTKKGELDPDYNVVKNENGDVLKYKGMVIGERPTEDVNARNKFYQQRSETRLSQLSDKHRQDGGFVTPGSSK